MVKSKNDIAFEILVLLIITLVGLACLIPILFVISYSLFIKSNFNSISVISDNKSICSSTYFDVIDIILLKRFDYFLFTRSWSHSLLKWNFA